MPGLTFKLCETFFDITLLVTPSTALRRSPWRPRLGESEASSEEHVNTCSTPTTSPSDVSVHINLW